MKKKAIYAGSFDPIHEGHLAVIKKALKMFDELLVIVSINPDKNNYDNLEERYLYVKKVLKDFKNVKVMINKNELIGDIAKRENCEFLIRSARNQTDFNYELVVAAGNHAVNHNLETILILPDYDMIDYSSSLIRHKEKLKELK